MEASYNIPTWLKLPFKAHTDDMVGWKFVSTGNSLFSMNVCGVSKHGSNLTIFNDCINMM